jgi:hypothetical protein
VSRLALAVRIGFVVALATAIAIVLAQSAGAIHLSFLGN